MNYVSESMRLSSYATNSRSSSSSVSLTRLRLMFLLKRGMIKIDIGWYHEWGIRLSLTCWQPHPVCKYHLHWGEGSLPLLAPHNPSRIKKKKLRPFRRENLINYWLTMKREHHRDISDNDRPPSSIVDTVVLPAVVGWSVSSMEVGDVSEPWLVRSRRVIDWAVGSTWHSKSHPKLSKRIDFGLEANSDH